MKLTFRNAFPHLRVATLIMRIFLLVIGLGWIALTPPSSGDCCNGADGMRCRAAPPALVPAALVADKFAPGPLDLGLPAELLAVDDGGL